MKISNKALFLVEDDTALRTFLQEVLSEAGYRVHSFGDAESALKAAEREAPRVLVTDLRLPGMDGTALFRAIRQRGIRMGGVVITAYATEPVVVRLLGDGFTSVLAKPFSKEVLLEAAKEALRAAHKLRSGDDRLEVVHPFRGWVEITSPSRQEYLRRLEQFADLLYGQDLAADEKEDIKVAVSEITSNAMEWGNQGDPSRRVKVSYCLFPDELVLKIEDEGEGFQPEKVPDPTRDPLDAMLRRCRSGKRAGGYGLHIVQHIMDEVLYNEKGNIVLLSKRLGSEDTTPERGQD